MLNKIVFFIVIVGIVLYPSVIMAQEPPKIVALQKGQQAPFSGTLLNPAAVAHTIAEKEAMKGECNLMKDYLESREKIKCDLVINSIQASLDALKIRNESILFIKNEEIERLNKLALNRPNNYSHWWLSGGIVIGIVTSITIFYAAVEIQETN